MEGTTKMKVLIMYCALIALLIFMLPNKAHGNEPICEVYNFDTENCETFAEQNLTVPLTWLDFKQCY